MLPSTEPLETFVGPNATTGVDAFEIAGGSDAGKVSSSASSSAWSRVRAWLSDRPVDLRHSFGRDMPHGIASSIGATAFAP